MDRLLEGQSLVLPDGLVSGEEIVCDGVLSDSRPGVVLRSGRDTITPAMA